MEDDPKRRERDDAGGTATPGEAPYRITRQPPLPARAPDGPERYRLYPTSPLPDAPIEPGWAAVAARFAPVLAQGGTVLLDGVVGVLWERLRADVAAALAAAGMHPVWSDVREAMLDEERLERLLRPYLGDDPLFGKRYPGTLGDLFDPERLQALARDAAGPEPRIVFGPGAALAAASFTEPGAFLAYVEVPKNEIQYRSRAGSVSNLGKAGAEDPKAMYKRFYFVDWPLCARHQERLLPALDLMIDAQRPHEPACATGAAVRAGLRSLAGAPFRPRPWFSPGAWGGQWIKDAVPELPQDVPNYAWSFELIAPENGIVFEADGRLLEVPFELLMVQEKERILGPHAERFGHAFPIRFDFLDTVEGGNLSLQCHPSADFAREQFGESLAQDETYYILDAVPGAEVFLGFRDAVDPGAFRAAVEGSARSGSEVDVRRFVQTHPARPHDLFLIPHGAIHCSGAGALVLEISATPYIFTFKIYDWLRLDLDGTPRPLNIDRAFQNLDFSMRGDAVRDELVARPEVVAAGDGFEVVHLRTHREHLYDVHRLEFTGEVEVSTGDSCHVLSLVDGPHVVVETEAGSWRYYFAETFVMPQAVGRYRLRSDDGTPLKVVKAYLK